MTLGLRKLIVLALVGLLFLVANAWLVVHWLDDNGMIDGAKHVRREYLTGTAITIIVVLMILLVGPRAASGRLGRRCPVCEHRVGSGASYCSTCGSKV